MRFDLLDGDTQLGEMVLGVPGEHNVRNALGAIAAARHLGADVESARRALQAFAGVQRRFQRLGTAAGITVLDDYAHHPTEIVATVAAARAAFPGRRLVAAFQPHLFTRTRDFVREFGQALAHADAVWVTEIYPAREAPIEGVTGRLVVDAVRAAGGKARFVDDVEALVNALAGALGHGDVLIAMGAGSIDSAAGAVFERLRIREREQ
jgi:UDP-N-acetylmuramate--alanine ligase